jgi:hypothetical protein
MKLEFTSSSQEVHYVVLFDVIVITVIIIMHYLNKVRSTVEELNNMV